MVPGAASASPSPEITVAMPVYNGERYLRGSIESVLAQNYERYELIVCDDGSTDSTPSLLATYRSKRLRVLRNERNQGLFSTLNRLVKASEGGLIHLWSQDDIMLPDCLRETVAFHKEHTQIAMSYCIGVTIDENGRRVGSTGADTTPTVISPRLAAQIMFYHGSMPGNISNVCIKKPVLLEVGPFREDLKVSGDFEMWVRLTEKYPMGYLKKPLVEIRSHSGQFSRRTDIGLQFLKEDNPIYETLYQRLPESIKEYARRYELRHRLAMSFHGLVRNLACGKVRLALEGAAQFKSRTQLLLAAFFWLITINARYLKLPPRYV
jgi:glycosyltransferase involved in cell wall biosynthesis